MPKPKPENANELAVTPLEELAKQLNAKHADVLGSVRRSVVDAAEAGRILMVVKSQTPRRFEQWVSENFDGSVQTARLYKRIAENWERIVDAGWLDDGLVGIAEIRDRLTDKKPKQAAQEIDKQEKEPAKNRTFDKLLSDHQHALLDQLMWRFGTEYEPAEPEYTLLRIMEVAMENCHG